MTLYGDPSQLGGHLRLINSNYPWKMWKLHEYLTWMENDDHTLHTLRVLDTIYLMQENVCNMSLDVLNS